MQKLTWDTVPYFGINSLSMILCFWSPLHPLSKLLAIEDHTQNWLGGATLNGREEEGQYYISQTSDQERFAAGKVVFSWECLNIFAAGCSKRDFCFSTSFLTCVDKALHGFISDFHVLVLKWISLVCVRFLFCCLFVIAVHIVSSIIHRCSEYINCIVTVHAITSRSSAYVVENTEIIKEQKGVYRR